MFLLFVAAMPKNDYSVVGLCNWKPWGRILTFSFAKEMKLTNKDHFLKIEIDLYLVHTNIIITKIRILNNHENYLTNEEVQAVYYTVIKHDGHLRTHLNF